MSQYTQQFTQQAEVTLNYLSSEELRDLLNDDEKLEARVIELVSRGKGVLVLRTKINCDSLD